AEEQSAHFERDHACAQERMSMGRLSAGIWAGQDGLQSLQPLECAGNVAEHLRGGSRTLLNRRNEWLSTARMSKRIAALAAEKGGRRNRRLASPRAGAISRFTALSISCVARGS